MEFEWDKNKAAANLSRHGVSFDEAKTVFDDPVYVDFYDPDHSYDEHRYIIIGESQRGRLLIVSYTERGDLVRLVSAREVTRREREASAVRSWKCGGGVWGKCLLDSPLAARP